MGKKLYLITCDNEFSYRETEKYLSEAEAKVIKEIFKDLSSIHIELKIEEIPSKETIKKLYDTARDIAEEFHNKYKNELKNK